MKATLRRLQTRAHGDRGFTLIELLVVVVIIGVLVAIAIPVYMNYTKGAADKAAQSDVRSAITAVENFYTRSGDYPASVTEAKASFDFTSTKDSTLKQKVTVSDKTTLSYVKGTDNYLICAHNEEGNATAYYVYDSAQGGSVKDAKAALTWTTCK